MAVRKKSRIHYIFYIIYAVAVVGAAILGFLGNTFFAYDIANQLWSHILYSLFISAFYIAAYVQELLAKRKTCDIVFNSFVFLGSLFCFYLFYFLNIYFTLIAIAHSAVLGCILFARFVLRIRATQSIPNDSDLDIKPFIAIFAIMLFVMVRALYSINYVSEIYMAWALIPTAIITVILGGIAVFLLWDLYRAMFIPIGKSILIALIGFLIVLAYCETTISIANYAFDYSEPTPIECEVLDMKVRSGVRTLTQYELKVIIDDSEMWIEVSPAQYYAISKDDVVTVNYHSGAFGFAYVIYDG